MNRKYRGMKVIESRMSKREIEKRSKVLKRRILLFDNRGHFKTRLLLAVGSLIRDMSEMWAAGVTFADILKVLEYAVFVSLEKEGYKGKIEFPFGIPFLTNPIYAEWERRP